MIFCKNKLKKELCFLKSKSINLEGDVVYTNIYSDYFYKNDVWHISNFKIFNQFQDDLNRYNGKRKNIFFRFQNEYLNLEFKYICLKLITTEYWSLNSLFNGGAVHINKLATFFNEKYPNINSLLDYEFNSIETEWIKWLKNQNVTTIKRSKSIVFGNYEAKTPIASSLKKLYRLFSKMIDSREEWDKDLWDIRNLEMYGLTYNKTLTGNYLNFKKIASLNIRTSVKKYLKQRLLTGNMNFATGRMYVRVLTRFLNSIHNQEPNWNDLNKLERKHMEIYIDFIF